MTPFRSMGDELNVIINSFKRTSIIEQGNQIISRDFFTLTCSFSTRVLEVNPQVGALGLGALSGIVGFNSVGLVKKV